MIQIAMKGTKTSSDEFNINPRMSDSILSTIAVLIMACNRPMQLEYALTAWNNVSGVENVSFYISLDCAEAPHIDWGHYSNLSHAKVISSYQRFNITELDRERPDERVTRHWLWAVTKVLRYHTHVLYFEDDHIVAPTALQDAALLITEGWRQYCPMCFAAQIGCHGDCWGMRSNDPQSLALMGPGNMGVVYSKTMWEWFLTHLEDYCSIYGTWDVNLHILLGNLKKYYYSITYLRPRAFHLPTCDHNRSGEYKKSCNWTEMEDDIASFLKKASLEMPTATRRPVYNDQRTNLPPYKKTSNILADPTTVASCMSSVAEAQRDPDPYFDFFEQNRLLHVNPADFKTDGVKVRENNI